MMDNSVISVFVSVLRAQSHLNDLEKDIIDTWNELNRTPFDLESAKSQELHNRTTYPDVQLAVLGMPSTAVKDPSQLDMNDLVYVLNCQLGLLIAKRFG